MPPRRRNPRKPKIKRKTTISISASPSEGVTVTARRKSPVQISNAMARKEARARELAKQVRAYEKTIARMSTVSSRNTGGGSTTATPENLERVRQQLIDAQTAVITANSLRQEVKLLANQLTVNDAQKKSILVNAKASIASLNQRLQREGQRLVRILRTDPAALRTQIENLRAQKSAEISQITMSARQLKARLEQDRIDIMSELQKKRAELVLAQTAIASAKSLARQEKSMATQLER